MDCKHGLDDYCCAVCLGTDNLGRVQEAPIDGTAKAHTTARWDSMCKACGEPIQGQHKMGGEFIPGDKIVLCGEGWVHEDCLLDAD